MHHALLLEAVGTHSTRGSCVVVSEARTAEAGRSSYFEKEKLVHNLVYPSQKLMGQWNGDNQLYLSQIHTHIANENLHFKNHDYNSPHENIVMHQLVNIFFRVRGSIHNNKNK